MYFDIILDLNAFFRTNNSHTNATWINTNGFLGNGRRTIHCTQYSHRTREKKHGNY